MHHLVQKLKRLIVSVPALFMTTVVFAQKGNNFQTTLQNAKHDTDKVNIIVNYCFEAVESNPDTVLLLCKQALQIAANIKDSSHHARIYQNMGIAFDIKDKLDSCLLFLNTARMIYKRMGLPIKESFIVNDIAIAYYYRGIYEVALRRHYEVLALRQQGNDKKLIAQSYNNIGLIYRAKKDYSNAVSFFRQSLLLKKEINDVQGVINTSMNIGSCFQFSKNYDSAYHYAVATEALARQHNKPEDITGAISNKGVALNGLKKYAEAEALLQQAMQQAKASNNTTILLTCLKGQGDVFYERQQFAKALQSYKSGAALAGEKERWKEQRAIFYEDMANCFAAQKDFANAYFFSGRYQALQDTLLNEENTRHINEMNVLYESEQKQKQIVQLNEDVNKGSMANLQSKKERNYLLLSSLLLLGLLAVIFISFRNSRIKSATLNEQNKVIEKALADKEVLLKEIHHRVKNNMQIVSSLLDLQSISIKDSEAAEAMKDGKNRVQSMALIHQNLYQQDNLKGINAKDYVGQLLMNLKDSYSNARHPVDIKTDIQDLNIDLDTMIPVGLILNELITNVFKYAVPLVQSPRLEIRLAEINNTLYIKVKDNGPGFAELADIKTAKTFGLKMVRAFAQKLKAKMEVENNQGAIVELFITKYKIV